MPKTLEELLNTEVGSRLISDWNMRWQRLPNPFSEPHPELRGVVGIFRIMIDNEPTYIVCASETKGGIAKGLKRISGPEQSGNRGYGAQMIRKHMDQVTVEFLRVDDQKNPEKVAKLLKRLMVNLYDPRWNWPFKRPMADIRDGIRPPDKPLRRREW